MAQIFFKALDPKAQPNPFFSPEELWVSDSTAGGAQLVKEINTAVNGSDPQQFTAGSLMYFTADDGVHGRELWASDGTDAGTVMLKDINPDQTDTLTGPLYLASVNGKLYFTANDGTHGFELWTSDGTTSGTVMIKDINAGANGSAPVQFANVNGSVF